MRRYSRQIVFLGKEKQNKILKSHIAIIGLGGTGSVAAEYLARSGANLILIDRDIVELNNLQRQLYTQSDIGKPKAIALKEKLENVNNEINIFAFCEDLNSTNIDDLLKNSDLIIDCTDNNETRFLINDFCMKNKIPFIYTAAIRSEGIISFIIPDKTPCLRCIIPKPSYYLDTCETVGVLSPVVGIIGLLASIEAIKYITNYKNIISNKILHLDILENKFELIKIKKRKKCITCNGIYEFLEKEINGIKKVCGSSFQFIPKEKIELDLEKIKNKIKRNQDFEIIRLHKFFLSMKYYNKNITLFNNGRILINNIKNEKEAKIIAGKILGF
ncbi:MAG: HesA/MoeB/ThiF family protein [Candidatus Aenigmatarchaeota archaeon]